MPEKIKNKCVLTNTYFPFGQICSSQILRCVYLLLLKYQVSLLFIYEEVACFK